jgi:fucose permease
MKKVSKQLMAFYIAQIALALVVVVLFELDVLPVGVMADDKQSDFIFTALMEIVSLGAAFLVMAIVGGALMPPLQGMIIDQHTILGHPAVNVSFCLPLICFIVIMIYGYRSYKAKSVQ